MRFRTLVMFLVLFFAFSQMAAKAINKFPPPTPATSGEEMYATYCADCHGYDGKGMARVRRPAIPDLTTLAKKNQGRFPHALVRDAISGQYHGSVYGSSEMPPWSILFQYVGSGNEDEIRVRIERLTEFIRTLQQK